MRTWVGVARFIHRTGDLVGSLPGYCSISFRAAAALQAEVKYARTAMADWLILLLLVPAIVLPFVLLVGFAGCMEPSRLYPPAIESAVGKSCSIITLTWMYAHSAPKFEVQRRKAETVDWSEGNVDRRFEAISSPVDDDVGLEGAKTYLYRVRAIHSDGDTTLWSSDVDGTTLSFAFEATLLNDEERWEDTCLVQRIEPTMCSGAPVKLTLRASSASAASIDRIYISKADPAGDPYDSAADLTAVIPATIVLPPGTPVTLAVNYNLDGGQPLLIAVEFSGTPPSGVMYREVPPQVAVAYFKVRTPLQPGEEPEARKADRTGYTRWPEDTLKGGIYLIEKIEVG